MRNRERVERERERVESERVEREARERGESRESEERTRERTTREDERETHKVEEARTRETVTQIESADLVPCRLTLSVGLEPSLWMQWLQTFQSLLTVSGRCASPLCTVGKCGRNSS